MTGTLAEKPDWRPVRHFEANALLTGGPDCPDNLPLRDLVARSEYLKIVFEGHTDASDPHPQYATDVDIKLLAAGVDGLQASKFSVSGGDLQGDLGLRGTRDRVTALGNVAGAVTIDASAGSTFTATATGAATWTFTGRPPAGQCRYVELRLVNGGAFTQTFRAGSVFSGGDRSLTAAGVDKLIVMLTADSTDISIVRGLA